jgi:membrane associated rhomboid family serine protease
MATPATDLLEIILRECAAARPAPWYPGDYARATGLPREALDEPLDRLRLAGLVRLTDWVQGKGQGYALTAAGEKVLGRPRLLDRLREGVVPRAEEPPVPRQVEGQVPGLERARAVRDALTDPARPVVTLGLIAANVLLFLVGAALARQRGVLSDYASLSLFEARPRAVLVQLDEVWHQLGSLSRLDLLARGEWWRLLTTCFLHMGVLHLLLNMYFLYVVGPLLERMLGPGRFLLLYAAAGVTGSCAAMLFAPNTVPIGASGALCGLLGGMAGWVYLNRSYMPRELSGRLMRAVITNVVLIVFISLLPGVSASGHFGGGVGGLAAAVPLTYSRFGRGPQRWLGLVAALLVPAAAVLWLESSLAPHRAEAQVTQARARCVPLVAAASDAAVSAFNKQVLPVCKEVLGNKRLSPKRVQEALARADEAREELRRIARELPEPNSYDDERLNAALGFARGYVEGWIDLFDQFSKSFAGRKSWGRDEAVAVLNKRVPVNRNEKHLQESVLYAGE